jgi:transposase
MPRKNYSEEFRRDAVELYRVTEGATITRIVADLGITDATLGWVGSRPGGIGTTRPAGAATGPIGGCGRGQQAEGAGGAVGGPGARAVTEKDILGLAPARFDQGGHRDASRPNLRCRHSRR